MICQNCHEYFSVNGAFIIWDMVGLKQVKVCPKCYKKMRRVHPKCQPSAR